MYDHIFFYKQVQISRSDIRPHIKWAVSLVILHMVTSMSLQGLCGYIWVNILTLSPQRVSFSCRYFRKECCKLCNQPISFNSISFRDDHLGVLNCMCFCTLAGYSWDDTVSASRDYLLLLLCPSLSKYNFHIQQVDRPSHALCRPCRLLTWRTECRDHCQGSMVGNVVVVVTMVVLCGAASRSYCYRCCCYVCGT